MAAVGIVALLFAVFAVGAIRVRKNCKNTVVSFLSPVVLHGNFYVFQFNFKPNFVLLEQQ